MRLSFDNQFLFSVGQDGCVFIHEVKDKDPRSGFKKEGMLLPPSDEILTEANEISQQLNEKESLENDLQNNQS